MMQEVGFCNGIENYSRHIDGRGPGEPPYTLLDFFPKDYLLVIDESHVAVPQLHGQYEGDRSRKETLVDHGFRLPSAADNRPLTFDECDRAGQPGASSCRPPRPVRAADRATRWSSRSSGRPASSTPRSSSSPPRARSTTSCARSRTRVERGRPRPRHHAHQEDGRGPDRLPARAGRAGPLPPQRGRHHRAHRDPAGPAPRRVRRAGRHQPPPRGPRPARGVAGGHPRRRQGGVPPLARPR